MPLYATPPLAHPFPLSASWRHYVHESLKTDIKNEAVNLLKTNGRKFRFSHGEAATLLKIGLLAIIEKDTKSW
jgi:hypothetical protein